MPHLKKRWESLAGRIAVAYAACSLLWIFGSDLTFGIWSQTPPRFVAAAMLKGSAFVLATALMLYLVIQRLLRSEFAARARAEETDRQLSQLQSIAEHSNDLLYQQDTQQRIIYVSPRCEQLVGYTPAEICADWQKILTESPINQAAVVLTERALRTGQKQPPYLIEVRTRQGKLLLMEVDESPLKDPDGRVTGIVGAARDVTARRAAERALQDSEGRFRALYESMNEGLALHELVLDDAGQPADYRILGANPAYSEITGLKRELAVGRLGSDVYGATPPPYLDFFAGVANGAKPASFEVYYPPFSKHLSISVFSPAPGQFATVFSDISKRKEAERQICLLNQVYSLLSNINDAIVRSTDRDALFQEACRICVEHGQFKVAWIGLLQADGSLRPAAWHGTDEGWVRSLFAQGCNGEGTVSQCKALQNGMVIVRSDLVAGERCQHCQQQMLVRGVHSSLCLPLKTDGRTIGIMCVYSAEPGFFSAIITESLTEVAANLAFALGVLERNRQREIEQQQMLLQHSALEAAANTIVITNRSGRIEWVNEAFTRLTGYSREEVIGGLPAILKSGAHPPEFYAEMWRTVLAGKVWQGQLTNRRKDGRQYHEEMTITPVRGGNGQVSHFIAIKQDITERKRLEQQFLRAQRMQSIGLLAGGVAHDLNNVLAPVMLALPLLRCERDAQAREQILQTLEQSVRRGATIVRQVLTFARGVEVQRAVVQLKHIMREVARIAEETFPRDIQIRCNIPPDLWPLQADPTQIHQVLLNLAVNARDAMPDGGSLTMSALNVQLAEPLEFQDFQIPPGSYVNLSVSDTGTGIAPEIMDRVFEPFFTTKPVGKGTGLGLSTVLGIVKSHGGLVQARSKPGRGATFSVYLPATLGARETPDVAVPQGRRGQGETVLLVDDEAAVLEVTQTTLERNGYRVLTARDGMQAVACFAQHSDEVKLVLTDVMMPFMDGVSLTRSLRSMNATVPVVAATGLSAAPGDVDRSANLRDLGVRHFLRKPFESDRLLEILRTALEEARTENGANG